MITSGRCFQGSVSQRPSSLKSSSAHSFHPFLTAERPHQQRVSLCFPNNELKEQYVGGGGSRWAWVRVPGPLPHNRWLLLGRNLLLFASSVFSSSTGPPCHPAQFVLCWRPFSQADGTHACKFISSRVSGARFQNGLSGQRPLVSLYSPVINQGVLWQMYLQKLGREEDCHKLPVTKYLRLK